MHVGELYEPALVATATVVAGVKPGQLADSTPCPGWDVRLLLHHIVGGNWMFATIAGGGTVADVPEMADVALDPRGAYTESAGAVIAAWSAPGALESTCHLPFGDMPGVAAQALHFLDNVAHGWDLARATKQDPGIHPEVAEAALTVAKGMVGPELRAAGAFGPEVKCRPDAPIVDRLVALLGRTP